MGRMIIRMIKGVIFDMDGVLTDSEPFIKEAAMRMFAEHGWHVEPEDFEPFVGAGENRYIGGPAEKYGYPLVLERDKARTYKIYGELVKGRLKPLPGVHEFINKCRGKGLKLAVASSADKIKVMINLNEVGLTPDQFDALVNGQDVTRTKPDPEIFLLAARRLGLPPSECLVIEDSVNGVAAAKAAGARCLAITSTFPKEQLAGADWFAQDLASVPDEAIQW